MSSRFRQFGIFGSGAAIGVLLFFVSYVVVPTVIMRHITAVSADDTVADSSGVSGPSGTNGAADPSGVTADPEVAAADQSCITGMEPIFQQEKTALISFLNSNFKNDQPNSVLLPAAFAALQNYRAHILKKAGQFSVQSQIQDQALDELTTCNERIQEEFAVADAAFTSFIKTHTSIKRSTALKTRLSQINGKLQTLQTLTARLTGYFTTFSHKLPGFVSQCLTEPSS